MEPLHILIAEDEDLAALNLKEHLESLGHEVVGSAATGPEAVQLARRLQPDLLIADIKMPELDGIEAARRITQERPLPVILLTAYSEMALIEQALDAAVLAYLVKPLRMEELQAALRLTVRRFEEFQALRQENVDLKEALETRKLVERAKGILMRRKGLSEEEAFRTLQQEARKQRKRMADMAQIIIDADQLL